MILRACNHEIRRRFGCAAQLGPDAGIGGRKRSIGQSWPIASDRIIECSRSGWINMKVRLFNPLDIRAEAGTASQDRKSTRLQSLMRISYAVFCLKKKKQKSINQQQHIHLHTQTT